MSIEQLPVEIELTDRSDKTPATIIDSRYKFLAKQLYEVLKELEELAAASGFGEVFEAATPRATALAERFQKAMHNYDGLLTDLQFLGADSSTFE